MRLYFCLLLLLYSVFNYGFKKNVMPYSLVVSKAVLIVDGTISKVSKNEYEFTISQFIKGKSSTKINVAIWKEWLCDPRMKELKSGQRMILFLEKSPYGNFYPINESTGELYVDNDTFPNILLPKDFSSPTVLKKGISMFLKTYTFYGSFDRRFFENMFFVRNKSIFEIYKMQMTNSFFEYLVNDVEYYNPTEIHQILINL